MRHGRAGHEGGDQWRGGALEPNGGDILVEQRQARQQSRDIWATILSRFKANGYIAFKPVTVPEPASTLFCGLGFLAALFRRRRH